MLILLIGLLKINTLKMFNSFPLNTLVDKAQRDGKVRKIGFPLNQQRREKNIINCI
jgi:hypothetical protein